MGIVFPLSANVIFSVARRDQQPDASGIMNTGINLGSSLGTAVLGLILIMGSFTSLGLVSINPTQNTTSEQITNVQQFFEKIELQNPGNNEKQKIVTSEKAKNMKLAFNVVSIILFIGLVMSLLIPPQKRKRKPTIGGVSSNI